MIWRRALLATVSMLAAAAATAAGCVDETVNPQGTTTGTTSTTAGTGGSTSSTTGTGGSTSVTTGTGGAGGQGGSAPTCLDASAVAGMFTIAQPSLCAVAMYEADGMIIQSFQTPTWGAHGGPLTVKAIDGGEVTLQRWTPPAGTSGKLTEVDTQVDAQIPAGAFVGSAAVDLPFFGWTAIDWSGAFPATLGEVILVKGAKVDKRYAANGAFALAGVSAAPEQGRLLLTGLSTVGDAMAGTNGLYAADTCGTAAMPALLPGADPACKAPLEVAAWGDASGPIAVDHDGNVFALTSSFSGDQEARAFAAASIGRGAAATPGATLFTLPGFGSALAALAPKGADKGLVAFQPFDGMTFAAEDVIGQGFSVAAGAVKAEGTPDPLLKMTKAGTAVGLFTDDQERLWVAVPTDAGTTFVVLARAP
jgi:hypothetical protein